MPENDDLRQFIRDIATRHERIWREQASTLRALVAELQELRTDTRDLREESRDLREDSRAQTRALLHVLDRLENGGAAA